MNYLDINLRPIVTLNALREFRVVENCHLGNNNQSEHCIQQMNHLGEHGPLNNFSPLLLLHKYGDEKGEFVFLHQGV